MRSLCVLLLVLTSCASVACLSKKQVQAYVFLHNGPLPESMCEVLSDGSHVGEGWDYGFYRKVKQGYEFISWCNPESKNWVAIHKDDLAKLMDTLVSDKK